MPQYVRAKIQKALTGRRWRPERLCFVCGKDGVRAGRKFCGQKCFGISKKGIDTWMKGKMHTKEYLKLMWEKHKGVRPHNYGKPNLKGRGKNCHLWKGGVTKVSAALRTSIEYKNWRRAVFERDDYICQMCGRRGGNLQADHIKPFALFPDLRFEISNGRTLCIPCHKTTDTFPKNLR